MLKFAGCPWLCSTKAKLGSSIKLRPCEIAFLNIKATWWSKTLKYPKLTWWGCKANKIWGEGCKIDRISLKSFTAG